MVYEWLIIGDNLYESNYDVQKQEAYQRGGFSGLLQPQHRGVATPNTSFSLHISTKNHASLWILRIGSMAKPYVPSHFQHDALLGTAMTTKR